MILSRLDVIEHLGLILATRESGPYDGCRRAFSAVLLMKPLDRQLNPILVSKAAKARDRQHPRLLYGRWPWVNSVWAMLDHIKSQTKNYL
jgi:hypothetical protein